MTFFGLFHKSLKVYEELNITKLNILKIISFINNCDHQMKTNSIITKCDHQMKTFVFAFLRVWSVKVFVGCDLNPWWMWFKPMTNSITKCKTCMFAFVQVGYIKVFHAQFRCKKLGEKWPHYMLFSHLIYVSQAQMGINKHEGVKIFMQKLP